MKNFKEIELECELRFRRNAQYWHLFTDGNSAEIIFRSREEFIIGMNLLGISKCYFPELKIFTFCLMNNHIHIILSGSREDCTSLFENFRTRLQRYFSRNDEKTRLKGFKCSLFPIDNLQSLRNEIVYVNRNGYLVNPDCTPFSYRWGANMFIFNALASVIYGDCTPYGKLSFRDKRNICRSNTIEIPGDDLRIFDGMILPSSFCETKEAESFYRDAHHYFYAISKKYEAYSAIAHTLGDKIVLTDDEMVSATISLCVREYGERRPAVLQPKQKIELAQRLHWDYNASNRQICSILKLDRGIVNELFPQ